LVLFGSRSFALKKKIKMHALLLISFAIAQSCEPYFSNVTIALEVFGSAPIPNGLYLDMENIYCAPRQSQSGGCDTGYHLHTRNPIDSHTSSSPSYVNCNWASRNATPQSQTQQITSDVQIVVISLQTDFVTCTIRSMK
jgi:hypothetical protein